MVFKRRGRNFYPGQRYVWTGDALLCGLNGIKRREETGYIAPRAQLLKKSDRQPHLAAYEAPPTALIVMRIYAHRNDGLSRCMSGKQS